MKRVITDETVQQEFSAGRRRMSAPPASTIITPSGWSKARELGVTFDDVGEAAGPKPGRPRHAHAALIPPTDEGRADRLVDRSGVTVVRGNTVELGRFTGAGAGKNIGLTDLITGKHGSPMTAGIMAWSKEDSFAWALDYAEIDYVMEGVLQVVIDGRSLEGGLGDVFYIPKGSKIVFGTPSRVKVFYVTYPADWAAPKRP